MRLGIAGLTTAFAMAAMLALAAPSQASEADISTAAYTNHAVALFDTAAREHAALGVLPGGMSIAVDRCHREWCAVHGRFGHGWVSLYALSFGHGPNSIRWPGELRHGPYNPWAFWGD